MQSTTSDMLPIQQFDKQLSFCWICQNTLSDSGGEPHYVRNQHHVIPQAYGGVDGPQVSLCSSHHDLLHFIALRLIVGNGYDDLTRGLSAAEFQRIMYLASRIRLASDYSKNDPNKRVIVAFKLTNKLNRQLSEIAKFKKRSKEDIIRTLIEESHRHLFPRK